MAAGAPGGGGFDRGRGHRDSWESGTFGRAEPRNPRTAATTVGGPDPSLLAEGLTTSSRRVRPPPRSTSVSGVVTWHDPSVRLPLRDALLAVVLMAIALVEILGPPLDQPGARTAFAVLTISGVLFRRSRPLVCATVVSAGMTLQSVLLESPDEIGVLLTVIVATFAVGAYAVGRARWLGTAIVCVGVAAAVLNDPSDTIANLAPTLLLFVGVPLAIGLAVQPDTSRHRRAADGDRAARGRGRSGDRGRAPANRARAA